jgi:hypothetical protein
VSSWHEAALADRAISGPSPGGMSGHVGRDPNVASHQPATAAAAQQLCVPLQQLRAFVCGCMAHPGMGELTCAVPLAHLARAMTRFGLVITAPDKESRHWLTVAGAVLGVLLLPGCWRAVGSQAGSRLAFRMISFNSLVALVISCSSAATAWRFPGGATREP